MDVTCEECGHDGFTIGRDAWDSAELTREGGATTETTTNVYATVLECEDCGTQYVLNRTEV
jgi:ribosomal protein S27E